ncbi:oxidoreductase [Armatimonadota bacterium]|nr:oxidoreductase [Armatimonadota bacterium]
MSNTSATLTIDETISLADLKPLPERVLGRIGRNIPIVGFGTAPLGSDNTTPEEATRILDYAMNQGVLYLDTAPVYGDPNSKYGNAEMKLKEILKTRRAEAFLVTKANSGRQTRDGILEQIEESLERMGVNEVDLVHIHNLGDFDMESFFKEDGALAGLQVAKERGLIRYLGISGHIRPARFTTVLDTGQIDLTMVTLNFADRYNYDFEGAVFASAKKHNVAVIAMKVLGGAVEWKYDANTPGTLASYHEQAIRYALGLPAVACAVIGFANEKEVAQALHVARQNKPLSEEEHTALLKIGKELASSRSLYYGPIEG